jgi:hypothetical protein
MPDRSLHDDDTDAEQLGPPVRELLELDEPAPPGLLGRIHRAVQRRLFAGEVIDLALVAPFKVLLEFITAIFGALAPQRPGDRR